MSGNISFFLILQDAMASGDKPPDRPKAFFVPDSSTVDGDSSDNDSDVREADVQSIGKNLKERTRSQGKGGKSFGKK